LPYKKKMALVLDQIVNQFSNAIKKKKCAGWLVLKLKKNKISIDTELIY
jgi:hypothetical protein